MSRFEELLKEISSVVDPAQITKDVAQELANSIRLRHTTYNEPMIRSDNFYWSLMGKLDFIDVKSSRGTRSISGGNMQASLTDSNYPCLFFLSDKAIATHARLSYEGYYGSK